MFCFSLSSGWGGLDRSLALRCVDFDSARDPIVPEQGFYDGAVLRQDESDGRE